MRRMTHMVSNNAKPIGVRKMIAIKKSDSVGNTFTALVATAFGCNAEIVVSPESQYGNCGTVEVGGSFYDWKFSGENVLFFPSV